MRKLFTLLLAVAASVGTMRASDTQVDGIWYDFDSSTKTASVTYRGNDFDSYDNDYSGSVVIPASVTYLSVKYSVTSIGDEAFSDCRGLTSVTIPNSVTSIGEWAFSGCSGLTSIEIPNNVTSIGNYAFRDCSGLTSIDIPNSVTSIGEGAFQNCSGLTSVTIPNSVTSIGNNAFDDCYRLKSVTIPNSVTSIGERAFYYCKSLSSIYNYASSPQVIDSDVFGGEEGEEDGIQYGPVDKTTCKLYVPAQSINLYKAAVGWKEFVNILPLESSDQGIDQVPSDQVQSTKVVRNGQVFILRGEKTYTLQGQEVK